MIEDQDRFLTVQVLASQGTQVSRAIGRQIDWRGGGRLEGMHPACFPNHQQKTINNIYNNKLKPLKVILWTKLAIFDQSETRSCKTFFS